MSKGSSTTRSGSSSTTRAMSASNGGGGMAAPNNWKDDGYGNYQTGIRVTDTLLSPTFQDRFSGVGFGTYTSNGERYLSVNNRNLTPEVANNIQSKANEVSSIETRMQRLDEKIKNITRDGVRNPSQRGNIEARFRAVDRQKQALLKRLQDVLK